MTTVITMPNSLKFASFDLRLTRPKMFASTEVRIGERAELEEPFWTFSGSTPPLTRSDYDNCVSFLEQADGGGSVVEVYNVFYQRPRAYGQSPLSGIKASGGAFNGTGSIQSISSRYLVSVSGLPAGFQISNSCLIEFRSSTDTLVRSLHRVSAAATASAQGVADVSLTHPLPQIVTSSFLPIFERASCLMRITDYSKADSFLDQSISLSGEEVMFS